MKRYKIEQWGNSFYVQVRVGLFSWHWIRYGDTRYPAYYPFDSYDKAVNGANGFLEDYGLFGLKWSIKKELKTL